jgi:hypothetical protein
MTRIRVKLSSSCGCSMFSRTCLPSQSRTTIGCERVPMRRDHGPSCLS